MIRIGGDNMKFINLIDAWWELDVDTMTVYNFMGGHHEISGKEVAKYEILELKDWHELYVHTNFCPIETTVRDNDVWVSPEGRFYSGVAHELTAEYLCNIIYGMDDPLYPGDYLDSHGWIRATTSLMWEIRFEHLDNRTVSVLQYNAIKEWCLLHNKRFPHIISSDKRRMTV